MALNPSIILAGKQPDLLNTVARADQAASQKNQMNRRNALNALYQEHGPGIMQGNEQSMNALAQFDPSAAMNAQQTQLGMDATRQGMRINEEELTLRKNTAKQKALEYAQKIGAEQAAAEKQRIANGLRGAAYYYQNGDKAGYTRFLQEKGLDPREYPFEQFPATAATLEGVLEAFETFAPDEVKPLSGAAKLAADLENGLITEEQYNAANQKSGLSVTMPDGTRITQGVPPGQNAQSTSTPRDPDKLASSLSSNDAATLKQASDDAIAASDLGSLATQLETVAPNVGYTGPGGALYGKMDELLGDALPGDSGSRGAFKSLAMEAQLSFTEKTKGAITDREMGMFREAVPNLGQRPEANKAIAQVMKAGAKRVQTRQAFLESWARKNGSLEGALEVWGQYMDENPLIASTESGGIRANEEGNWQAYLGRRPANTYTPEAIMGMGENELSMVPIEKMNETQLEALELRYQQIGGGQ